LPTVKVRNLYFEVPAGFQEQFAQAVQTFAVNSGDAGQIQAYCIGFIDACQAKRSAKVPKARPAEDRRVGVA
jgi:hypothetical protein